MSSGSRKHSRLFKPRVTGRTGKGATPYKAGNKMDAVHTINSMDTELDVLSQELDQLMTSDSVASGKRQDRNAAIKLSQVAPDPDMSTLSPLHGTPRQFVEEDDKNASEAMNEEERMPDAHADETADEVIFDMHGLTDEDWKKVEEDFLKARPDMPPRTCAETSCAFGYDFWFACSPYPCCWWWSWVLCCPFWPRKYSMIRASVMVLKSFEIPELSKASMTGDHEKVYDLLQRGAEQPNSSEQFRYGFAAIHYAAFYGHESVVEALLAFGCNPDLRSSISNVIYPCGVGNQTALHISAEKGHQGIITKLLKAGCAPDARDSCGRTPLHYAAIFGHEGAVRAMLAGGSTVVRDKFGKTALHYAASCMCGRLRCWSNHSEDMESMGNSVDIIQEHDPNWKYQKHLLSVCTGHCTAQWEERCWKRSGCKISRRGHAGIMKLLLAADAEGSSVCKDSVDQDGCTALHIAVSSGDLSVVRELLLAGCATDIPNKEKLLPLHVGVLYVSLDQYSRLEREPSDWSYDRLEIVDQLARACPDIDARDGNGCTPLMLACGKAEEYYAFQTHHEAYQNRFRLDGEHKDIVWRVLRREDHRTILLKTMFMIDAFERIRGGAIEALKGKGAYTGYTGYGALFSPLHPVLVKKDAETRRSELEKYFGVTSYGGMFRRLDSSRMNWQNLDLVGILLGRSAKPELTDDQNRTCLHIAMNWPPLKTMHQLRISRTCLPGTADDIKNFERDAKNALAVAEKLMAPLTAPGALDARDDNNQTALQLAVHYGLDEIAMKLIQSGAHYQPETLLQAMQEPARRAAELAAANAASARQRELIGIAASRPTYSIERVYNNPVRSVELVRNH